MNSKSPSESLTHTTEIVYPNDSNPHGILNGGRIVQWMDTACAISAQRHSGSICVTIAIDGVQFRQSAKLGDIISITAKITRVFNTSMEIYAEASVRRTTTGEDFLLATSYFTFVAIDTKSGEKVNIYPVHPETEEEKREYENAKARREARFGH